MTSSAKQAIVDLAAALPEDCSWDEVMYQLYVRQKIQQGLADVEAGHLVPHDEIIVEYADAQSLDQMDKVGPA